MSRNLDWRWIGIGVAIMLGLSLVAGLISAAILGDRVEAVALVAAERRVAASASFTVATLGLKGSRTSSMTAIGALSPLRAPTLVMRV